MGFEHILLSIKRSLKAWRNVIPWWLFLIRRILVSSPLGPCILAPPLWPHPIISPWLWLMFLSLRRISALLWFFRGWWRRWFCGCRCGWGSNGWNCGFLWFKLRFYGGTWRGSGSGDGYHVVPPSPAGVVVSLVVGLVVGLTIWLVVGLTIELVIWLTVLLIILLVEPLVIVRLVESAPELIRRHKGTFESIGKKLSPIADYVCRKADSWCFKHTRHVISSDAENVDIIKIQVVFCNF